MKIKDIKLESRRKIGFGIAIGIGIEENLLTVKQVGKSSCRMKYGSFAERASCHFRQKWHTSQKSTFIFTCQIGQESSIKY